MQTGNHREVPPIFRDLATFQIGVLPKSSLGRRSKCFYRVWMIGFPNRISIESVLVILGKDEYGVMLAVESSPDG